MKRFLSSSGVYVLVVVLAGAALAQSIRFSNTVTGEPLDLGLAQEEERDTEAVKHFLETGKNIYNMDPEVLQSGERAYLSACSGCHGMIGEGKLGPGLNDAYWTYRKNRTDVGLFETIFGGAQGMMGPMYQQLTLDETLRVMAWVRHLYTGEPETAVWLSEEQRKDFTPFERKQ